MSGTRENWGSRFGFVMAAAGSAVGLGNMWGFPYKAGEHGGAFLIIYLALVMVFGLSLVVAEFVLGRASQRSPVGAFRIMAGRGWPALGVLGIATAFVILSFYIVVAGWTVAYIGLMARGALAGGQPEAMNDIFNAFVTRPIAPIVYAGGFMIASAAVVIGGVSRGIERTSKLLMPMLFVILIVLALRSVTLPGAGVGLSYFLVPDWSAVTGATWTAAISQVFFSLSLGMGAMLTYSSYMPREHNLPRNASLVVTLDTLVALLAGLAIIPAVFAVGLQVDAGPSLTFITLPAVFAQMPGGVYFGVLFFILLAIAALTSAVSLLEVVVSYFVDEHNMRRAPVTVLCALLVFALGVPSSLSMGVWSDNTIFGQSFLDLMNFISTGVMMPIGGLLIALCVGWVVGPKAIEALKSHPDQAMPLAGLWLFILRFVAPVGIAWILLQSFIG